MKTHAKILALLLLAALLVTALTAASPAFTAYGETTANTGTRKNIVLVEVRFTDEQTGQLLMPGFIIEQEKGSEYDLTYDTVFAADGSLKFADYEYVRTDGELTGIANSDVVITVYYTRIAQPPLPQAAQYYAVERPFTPQHALLSPWANRYGVDQQYSLLPVNGGTLNFLSAGSAGGTAQAPSYITYRPTGDAARVVYASPYLSAWFEFGKMAVKPEDEPAPGVIVGTGNGTWWGTQRMGIEYPWNFADDCTAIFLTRDEVVRFYIPTREAETLFTVENAHPEFDKIAAMYPLSTTDVFYMLYTDREQTENYIDDIYDHREMPPTADNPRVEYYVYSSLTDKSYYLGNGFDTLIYTGQSAPASFEGELPCALHLMLNEQVMKNVRMLYLPQRQADLDAQQSAA